MRYLKSGCFSYSTLIFNTKVIMRTKNQVVSLVLGLEGESEGVGVAPPRSLAKPKVM